MTNFRSGEIVQFSGNRETGKAPFPVRWQGFSGYFRGYCQDVCATNTALGSPFCNPLDIIQLLWPFAYTDEGVPCGCDLWTLPYPVLSYPISWPIRNPDGRQTSTHTHTRSFARPDAFVNRWPPVLTASHLFPFYGFIIRRTLDSRWYFDRKLARAPECGTRFTKYQLLIAQSWNKRGRGTVDYRFGELTQ